MFCKSRALPWQESAGYPERERNDSAMKRSRAASAAIRMARKCGAVGNDHFPTAPDIYG